MDIREARRQIVSRHFRVPPEMGFDEALERAHALAIERQETISFQMWHWYHNVLVHVAEGSDLSRLARRYSYLRNTGGSGEVHASMFAQSPNEAVYEATAYEEHRRALLAWLKSDEWPQSCQLCPFYDNALEGGQPVPGPVVPVQGTDFEEYSWYVHTRWCLDVNEAISFCLEVSRTLEDAGESLTRTTLYFNEATTIHVEASSSPEHLLDQFRAVHAVGVREEVDPHLRHPLTGNTESFAGMKHQHFSERAYPGVDPIPHHLCPFAAENQQLVQRLTE